MLEQITPSKYNSNYEDVCGPFRLIANPYGLIVGSPVKTYSLVGNRGVLHDSRGALVRSYGSRAWLACTPRRSSARQPGTNERPRYTLLFFLDEATALAAGHRPCFTCRRVAFDRFRAAWVEGNNEQGSNEAIRHVDAQLHSQRAGAHGEKITYTTECDSLPNGCMVKFGDGWYLVYDEHLYQWSTSGYVARIGRPCGMDVSVLTPKGTVAALQAGYRPQIHHSAGEL